MRKQSILSITTTLCLILLISSCWFISCRKSQQQISPGYAEDTAGQVTNSQNDDLLSLLAAKVEKQINASRASENIAAFAGQPDWQQSLIIEKNEAASRSKKKKAKAIVYTPFSKKMNVKLLRFYDPLYTTQTQPFLCCTRKAIFSTGSALTATPPGTLTIYSTSSLHLTITFMEPASIS